MKEAMICPRIVGIVYVPLRSEPGAGATRNVANPGDVGRIPKRYHATRNEGDEAQG
jgi:hypothetical protein